MDTSQISQGQSHDETTLAQIALPRLRRQYLQKVGDYCNLHDKIWKDELRLKDTDNMCINCIEARLGRKLIFADFSSVPPNLHRTVKGYKLSDRLVERLGLSMSKKRSRAKMQQGD